MEEPPIRARHLILCRRIDYDPFDAEAPYSLRGLLSELRPDGDIGYPLCHETMWVYFEVFGEPGRYLAQVVLFKIDPDGTDLGPPLRVMDTKPVRVRVGSFVDGVRFQIFQIPFETPGLYEFRLLVDGFDEPLVSVRLSLSEYRQ